MYCVFIARTAWSIYCVFVNMDVNRLMGKCPNIKIAIITLH